MLGIALLALTALSQGYQAYAGQQEADRQRKQERYVQDRWASVIKGIGDMRTGRKPVVSYGQKSIQGGTPAWQIPQRPQQNLMAKLGGGY